MITLFRADKTYSLADVKGLMAEQISQLRSRISPIGLAQKIFRYEMMIEPIVRNAPLLERVPLARKVPRYVNLATQSVAERMTSDNLFKTVDPAQIFGNDVLSPCCCCLRERPS